MKVTNNRRGKVRLAGGVELCPGENRIAHAAWRKCCDHPITQHYISRGELQVAPASACSKAMGNRPTCKKASQAEAGPYVPESPPLPLTPVEPARQEPPPADETDVFGVPMGLELMRARDVIGLVRLTYDVRALRQMLTIESRATVVRAIDQRICELRG